MEFLFIIVVVANFVTFFMTLLALLADKDLKQYLLPPCIISGVTTILLIIFMNTTPLAIHALNGTAVIEYKIQNGNVVDSCYVFKK